MKCARSRCTSDSAVLVVSVAGNMKPPARRTGSSNAKDKAKKRKGLSYRSPHSVKEKNEVSSTFTRCSPAHKSLLSSPTLNLSDLNSELFSCIDKIDLNVMSSTPMTHTATKKHKQLHHGEANGLGSCFHTSSLFGLSNSQACSSLELCASGMSSFMTTPFKKDSLDNLKLSEWGIPNLVLEQYAKRGITSMYKWQAECLMLPGILEGGNLVFSAPTSAGKTFIAELLALKCVLESKKKVLIILPFVSIAHEKANYLQNIFEPNGVKVGGFMGGHSPSGGFAAVDIAICTIEKANSLVNRLLEEGSISELGAVVVDELHMIGDLHRGYLLELLLTKLLYVCKKNKVKEANCDRMVHSKSAIQIVGMSATLPNLDVLSTWLEGQLYCTDFRPVPLQEMVKVGPTLFDTDFKKIRDLCINLETTNDEEDILKLCEETVTNGHSVLIFCPTKQWCETLAGVIAQAPFLQAPSSIEKESEEKLVLQFGALVGVVQQLQRTQVGLDGILAKTVPCGVGFHHAGLTFDEREIIEGAFRHGLLRVLVATSTLSSGVNLPARLVIVRTPFFQRSLLDVLVYKQMVGRAGRKGVDERGESVLICKPSEQSKVSSLFQSTPKPVTSCLDLKKESKKGSDVSALRRAVLEIITSGIAKTHMEVELYLKCTLLYTGTLQEKASHSDIPTLTQTLITSSIDYLVANEFIALRNKQLPTSDKDLAAPLCDSGSEYHATQLGAATVASALSPEEALVVFNELRKARRSFVLESELHIIYLVTPVYIQEQWPSIDWYRFLCLLERLPPDIKHVASTLGVQESFLASAIQGRIPERTVAQQERLRIHRRFFTALALHDLVREAPIVYVARKYSVSKGLLQTLQTAAGTFSGMVTVFCSRLGWKNLELLLSQFQSRLSFGVERELCDLVRVSLLNGFRARALYNAGFHSLSSLATANPLALEHCLRNALPFKSSKVAAEGSNADGTTWCAKLRRGMTEYEAACEIVYEAQKILSEQMNLPLGAWRMIQEPKALSPKVEPINNGQNSSHRKRPYHSAEQKGATETAKDIHVTDDDKYFKTPKQIKTVHQRRSRKESITPFIATSQCAQTSTIAQTSNQPPPIPLPCINIKEDESISYSPIFSPGLSASIHQTSSCSLLCTPLPLEDIKQSPVPLKQLTDVPSSSSHPLTVPNSLPCSLDMSNSFSCSTFAMIDAACCDASPDNMSCSIISVAEDAESKNCESGMMKVAESPALLEDSCAMGNMASKSEPPNYTLEENTTFSSKIKHDSHSLPTSTTTGHHTPLCSQSRLKDLSQISSSQVSFTQSGTCVIDVTSNPLLFETFVTECLEQRSVSFSVAVTSLNQGTIGIKIVEPQTLSGIPIPHRSEQIVGVAICWGGMDVYYISLYKPVLADSAEAVPLALRIDALYSIFQSQNCQELISYSLKKNLQTFATVFGIVPTAQSLDPQVADWMLNPDGKQKTIHKMVLHYLPDQPLLSEGEDYEELPLSNLATHGSEPHIQASAEVLLASLLISKMRALLKEEGLWTSFLEVEMPSLIVLTKMELNGIGFSKKECDALKQMLELRLIQIETEAYTHAQRSFSLTSPEDVARVLFLELQLPTSSDSKQQKTLGPNRRGKKRTQHLSTAKDVLEKLQSVHPLPGLILEWRRISSTVTKTVFPLFKDAVCHTSLKSVRIHSTYQIHTATGRVATSDPNLQMVPKEYDIGSKTSVAAMLSLKGTSAVNVTTLLSESQCFRDAVSNGGSEHNESEPTRSSVSMRSVFVPFPGGVFLAADYSQLELRILAHMSDDKKLQRVLNSKGDVFKMIAGEWLGVPATHVTAEERQQTKQICYGMVYGIGAKALSEQLKIQQEDAAQFMDTFKSKYPSMKKFISNTVQSCRDNGYVVTLLGRKRFLSGIHSQNVHARSQAERQAVNSTIQGSAADLVKTAMINIDRELTKQYNLSPPFLTYSAPDLGDAQPKLRVPTNNIRGAYLVLQLHDELLYEVCKKDLPRVAEIVQYQMENSLQLSVKFPVKMQVGSSWGHLKPYTIVQQ